MEVTVTVIDCASLDTFLCALPHCEKDFKQEWGWFRYRIAEKMFAAVCTPADTHREEYLGHTLLNLKCDPAEAAFLTEQYADILPGFYMDKRTWIAVRLDGDVPEALVKCLIEQSYRLIEAKLTKKQRADLIDSDPTCPKNGDTL